MSSASAVAGLRRRISDFCRQKVSTVLTPLDADRFTRFALQLIDTRCLTPRRRDVPDWSVIAETTGIPVERLRAAQGSLRPGLDAIDRTLRTVPSFERPPPAVKPPRRSAPKPLGGPSIPKPGAVERSRKRPPPTRTRSARSLQPGEEPATFDEALDFHMYANGDTAADLLAAILPVGGRFDARSIRSWRQGRTTPRSVAALGLLKGIEARYGLETGYFARLLPDPRRATTGHHAVGIGTAEHRRLAWHLPDDFSLRSRVEQEEILLWVRSTIIAGTTAYRRYQAAASKTPFGLRFTGLGVSERHRDGRNPPSVRVQGLVAPARLQKEMGRLIAFKTAVLTAMGYRRSGVWGAETAAQKIEHLSLFFGALAATSSGPVQGRGVPMEALTLALLVFPSVWDWYLQWRADRRGFYTQWEIDMLSVGVALTHKDTGWIRQSPDLAEALVPIPGLVCEQDIAAARADWSAACERVHVFGMARAKEVQRVCRVHRDPFEPILSILEAESPVGEYRKITDEIRRLEPDVRRFPRAAAESARSYLMLRLGLHLGLRQKNLRQLLVCARDGRPRSERELEDLKRGELRWSRRDGGWEVLVPAVAFKNAHSSFFGQKPYRLVLPDLDGLYDRIEAWIERHRPTLLRHAPDPGTFFVKTVKTTSADAAYNQTTFYEAWRLAIQRYGIYNPYTGRGAIEGLLPHGPHNVRDVLATHILKQTGSYEQASYAIQDTPDTVAAHYGRFLPQDKAALAAQILNQVWTS